MVKASKVSVSKMWVWLLVIGILCILLGIYSFFHPFIVSSGFKLIVGVFVGVYFIMTGCAMVITPSEK